MFELKRILKAHSKTILLTLLVVLNIFVFSLYLKDKYLDNQIFRQTYEQELLKLEDMNEDEGIKYLEEQSKHYELVDELIKYIKNVDNDEMFVYREDVLEFYDSNPELVKNIKDNNINVKKEKIKMLVFSKILEQVRHIDGYTDFLNDIENNKEELLTFSIFNRQETYSYKNIMKTADDYYKLKNIKLDLGNYLAVEDLNEYKIINIFIILSILVIVFSFIEDRKKGLKELINSTKNGRRKLILNRLFALLLSSILICLIMYGGILVISFVCHGGLHDIKHLIISVPMFSKMTLTLTILEYISIFIITKIFSLFLIGLLIWYVISKVRSKNISFLILILFFSIEYILYQKIDFNSYLSIFKAVNIFPLIFLSDTLKEYININISGNPINYLLVVFMVLVLMNVVLVLLHFSRSSYERNHKFVLIDRINIKIRILNDFIINKFSMFFYEFYKIVVLQKGWIILLLFVYIISNFNFIGFRDVPLTLEEQIANSYAKEYQGVVNNDLVLKLESLKEGFNEKIEDFKLQEENYKNDKLNYYEYYVYKVDMEQATIHLQAIELLKQRVESLKEKSETIGIDLWLLDEENFNNSYGTNSVQNQKIEMVIVLVVLMLLLANSFTFENESNTRILLNTTKNKNKLTRSKVVSGLFITIIVWVFSSIIGFIQFAKIADFTILNAPIQSLKMIKSFPLNINIAGYICLFYIAKLIFMLIISNITIYISFKSKKQLISYCLSIVLIGIIIVLIALL